MVHRLLIRRLRNHYSDFSFFPFVRTPKVDAMADGVGTHRNRNANDAWCTLHSCRDLKGLK